MIKIFVEGKGDSPFVIAYIKHLFGGAPIPEHDVIGTGGWTKLKFLQNEFKKVTDIGGKNLVIFDADSPNKGGGCRARRAAIIADLASEGVVIAETEIFLFPNNELDGDYEVMLEEITSGKHDGLLRCFEAYEQCLTRLSGGEGEVPYETPNQKVKMYSYINSHKVSSKKKERIKKQDLLFEDEEYWDLNRVFLNPLKEFISTHFQLDEN